MYTENEYAALRGQLQKRTIGIAVLAALTVAASILFFIQRNQMATTLATLIGGAAIIFCWDCFVRPLRAYARHVDQMLHGRLHEAEGDYVSLEADSAMVEGVAYRTMHLTCLDDAGKPYDRIFHIDAEKTLPAYAPGQRLRVTYSSRMAARVEAI